MTGIKIWRLSLSAILMFGWLFLVPAHSESDPLTVAAAEIAELNSNLENLVDKASTQDLIYIAENKYQAA
ncbi:MAG: hypothetical protein ACO3UU_12880, partial [Minisyncoccia bacterium]